jgi:hypothetical protein
MTTASSGTSWGWLWKTRPCAAVGAFLSGKTGSIGEMEFLELVHKSGVDIEIIAS